jgi:Rrf2 family transcriptional regulator, iron-sulfur cluster assembly transcription factor
MISPLLGSARRARRRAGNGNVMKITATEEYGLRCMLQLALHPTDTVSLTELARAENIAPPFAAKVLLRLRRAGLVVAARGRNGGYTLAAPPESITVLAVLSSLGKPLFDAAFCSEHGSPDESACSRLTDCSLRPVWAHLDAMLRQFFSQTTLADLVRGEGSTRAQLAERWPLLLPSQARQSLPRRTSR